MKTDEATLPTSLPDNSHCKHKGISLELLMDLRRKGLSYSQIARSAGCSKSTVIGRLKEYKGDLDNLEGFKRNRADIFALLQRKILLSLTDAEIKKAPLQVKMMAAGVLYDKERLERGKSTGNVGVIFDIDDATRAAIAASAAQLAVAKAAESAGRSVREFVCESE